MGVIKDGRQNHEGPTGVSAGEAWWSLSRTSAPEGTRTPNLLIRSQMLYPLSYGRSPREPTGPTTGTSVPDGRGRCRITSASRPSASAAGSRRVIGFKGLPSWFRCLNDWDCKSLQISWKAFLPASELVTGFTSSTGSAGWRGARRPIP